MHVLRYGAESRLNVLRYAMHVLRYGAESRIPSQCIKIGDACIKTDNACIKIRNRVFPALCDNFRQCEIFLKKFKSFCWPADAYNYYARG